MLCVFFKKRAANKVAKHITKNRTLTACALRQPYNKYNKKLNYYSFITISCSYFPSHQVSFLIHRFFHLIFFLSHSSH